MLRAGFALTTLLIVVLVAGAAQGGSVVGSDHDMSAMGGARTHAGDFFNDYNEVCVYCHTPHGADPAVPLWNRQLNSGDYTLYDSMTLDAIVEQPALAGVTRMCLSCHDGTIAVDELVNVPNKPFSVAPNHMGMATAGQSVGGSVSGRCSDCHPDPADDGVIVDVAPSFLEMDMKDNHPISFVYDQNLVDTNNEFDQPLAPPTNPSGLGGTIDEDMLINSRVECVSCHDVHNPDIFPFLLKTLEADELCNTCHIM